MEKRKPITLNKSDKEWLSNNIIDDLRELLITKPAYKKEINILLSAVKGNITVIKIIQLAEQIKEKRKINNYSIIPDYSHHILQLAIEDEKYRIAHNVDILCYWLEEIYYKELAK